MRNEEEVCKLKIRQCVLTLVVMVYELREGYDGANEDDKNMVLVVQVFLATVN